MVAKQARRAHAVHAASHPARTERAWPNLQWAGDVSWLTQPSVREDRSHADRGAAWLREAGWERQLYLMIQRGPQEEVPWSGAFSSMRGVLNADHVAMILRRPSPRTPGLIIDASAESVKSWRGGYSYYPVYTRDPFSGLPEDHVVTVDEVLGTEAWEDSPFYQRYIKPLDVRYILGADIVTEGGVKCRFRVSRSAARGEFGQREHAICNELLPYLKVSIDIHAHLDAQRMQLGTYARVMEQLLIGVVIFDEKGALMHTNGAADDILAEGDGLRLANGGLRAAFSSEDREIQRALQEALKDAVSSEHLMGKVLSVTRRSGRSKLGVLVRSIPLGAWSQRQKRPAAAMFLRDPEKSVSSSRETMRSLFGLTKAEAVLATHLVNGCSLDEAAATLNIKRNTARAQLRSIFAKTGVRRQSMLVRLLLNSIATMGEGSEDVPEAS